MNFELYSDYTDSMRNTDANADGLRRKFDEKKRQNCSKMMYARFFYSAISCHDCKISFAAC